MDAALPLLIGLSALWLAGYWISLHLHPFTTCPTCKGTARHRGTFFSHATRACGTCDGTSRVLRLGVRLFLNDTDLKYKR